MNAQSEPWQDEEQARRYSRQSKIGTRVMYTPFAKKIVQRLGALPQEATVVDLGTGPGLLAIELHKLWPQATVIGVDPSSEMLSIATRNAVEAGLRDFETRQGTAEELPLSPATIDLVVSQSSFHEWQDPHLGLGEVFRSLKPGGSLVLKDFNAAWLSPWKRKLLGRFHHLDMFRYTFQQVVDLLTDAGFEEITVDQQGVQYVVRGVKP
jgi:ubiquinone/menaquinone biosynthesis C-methylase UbiE